MSIILNINNLFYLDTFFFDCKYTFVSASIIYGTCFFRWRKLRNFFFNYLKIVNNSFQHVLITALLHKVSNCINIFICKYIDISICTCRYSFSSWLIMEYLHISLCGRFGFFLFFAQLFFFFAK